MVPSPTIYEVAERAGVSIATVSRALQGKDNLRPQTRQKVLDAAAELGYLPSGAARGLATRRAGVLGMVFPDLDDPGMEGNLQTLLYADEVIRGMERAARQAGYAVLIAATHHAADPELVRSLAGRTDGMVVLARTLPAGELERLARGLPVVLLAGPYDDAPLDHVEVANDHGAQAATAHLVDRHGHREVCFVGGPADSPDAGARFQGHCRALAAAGLPVPAQPDATGDFTFQGGLRAVRERLTQAPPPHAIVCANDQMAVGALEALAEAGLEAGGQVAVTGFDDIQLARHVTPALTTVYQPMRQLGAVGAELLLERLAQPQAPPRTVVLPTRLVVRASCGCGGEEELPSFGREAAGELAGVPSKG